MQESQKTGFLIILGAVVFIIFAFMISDDLWLLSEGGAERGFYQRFMTGYFVILFQEEGCHRIRPQDCYEISFLTKWAVFTGICIAAYGVTVYKSIARFPPWKR